MAYHIRQLAAGAAADEAGAATPGCGLSLGPRDLGAGTATVTAAALEWRADADGAGVAVPWQCILMHGSAGPTERFPAGGVYMQLSEPAPGADGQAPLAVGPGDEANDSEPVWEAWLVLADESGRDALFDAMTAASCAALDADEADDGGAAASGAALLASVLAQQAEAKQQNGTH